MRKGVILVGVVVVVGLIVGLVLIFTRGPAIRPHLAEETATMMSLDTDLYFSLNLSPGHGQLPKLGRLLKTLAGNRDAKRTWDEWMDDIRDETGIDMGKEALPWLGPEIAIGVTGLTEEEPQFVLMIGTRDVKAIKETLNKWWEYLRDAEDMEFKTTSYRNVDITIGETSWGERQYYAITEGYLLFSNDSQAIHRTVDLIQDKGTSLADKEGFKTAQRSLPEGHIAMLYYDSEEIVSKLDELLDTYTYEEKEALTRLVRSLIPAYVTAGISLSDNGGALQLGFPRPEGLQYTQGATSAKIAKVIPKDAPFFLVGRNLKALWQEIRSTLEEEEEWRREFEESMEELRSELGIDLDEDIFSWMDGEFAFAALTEYPELLLVFEIRNKRSVAKHLDSVLSGLQGTEEELEIEQTTIEGTSATLIKSEGLEYEGLSPGYLFLGNDYLVFSLTVDALTEAVRTYQGRHDSLRDSKQYKDILSALPRQKGWISYLDFPKIMAFILPELEPWDREEYEENFSSVEEIICNLGLSVLVAEENVSTTLVFQLCSSEK